MNKNLETIVKEMCNRVGADFSTMDFKKERWFWDYSWSQTEQEDFKQWLIRFLSVRKNREDILRNPRLGDKKTINNLADVFLLQFGWKVEYVKPK